MLPRKYPGKKAYHQRDGASNFVKWLFEMEPNGCSPSHKHAWEHEVFVLEGDGLVFDGKNTTPLQAGDVVFVTSNELHKFKNNCEKR